MSIIYPLTDNVFSCGSYRPCNRLLETAVFLVGSAYFVAGSYPEALSAADLDSAHSKHINIPTTSSSTGPVVGTGTDTGSTMSGALDADLEMNRNGSVLDAVSAPMHEDEDSP